MASTADTDQKLASRDEYRIQLALSRSARAAALATAAVYAFVYRPGGVAAGNVYTSWPALYAALGATEGPKLVQIDDSIVSPAPVPAGTYNLDGITLVGITNPVQEFATLQFENGAHVTIGALFVRDLEVESASSSPVFTAGAISYIESFFASFTASAASPMFEVPAGENLVIQQSGGNFGDGTNPAATVDAGGSFEWTGNGSDLEPNSVTGAGAAAGATYFYDAATIVHDPNPPGTFAAMDEAKFIAYEPAVASNWPATPPAKVNAALDELATRLIQTGSALAAGPTPINNAGLTNLATSTAVTIPAGAKAVVMVSVEYDAGAGNGTDQRITQVIQDAHGNTYDTVTQDLSSNTNCVITRTVQAAPVVAGANQFSVLAQDSLGTAPNVSAKSASVVVLSVGV